MKTFWNVLGVPYLNQYDAGATDLSDFFADGPDATPYRAVPVDGRIFDPQQALDPMDAEFDWSSLAESPELDDAGVMQALARDEDDKRRARQKGPSR
jgi:hypothetical protein